MSFDIKFSIELAYESEKSVTVSFMTEFYDQAFKAYVLNRNRVFPLAIKISDSLLWRLLNKVKVKIDYLDKFEWRAISKALRDYRVGKIKPADSYDDEMTVFTYMKPFLFTSYPIHLPYDMKDVKLINFDGPNIFDFETEDEAFQFEEQAKILLEKRLAKLYEQYLVNGRN